MTARISVITAALPSRLPMLAQAVASVSAQTFQPVEHLILVDHDRRGTGAAKTQLAHAARGDWVATLDDDDLLDPDHLALLAGYMLSADIVYSWCRVVGRDGWTPNRHFDADALRRSNFIPATALIRRDLIVQLGGWRDSAVCEHGWEDWDFWLRALNALTVFRCVPEVTWTYRFHPGSKTVRGEKQAA